MCGRYKQSRTAQDLKDALEIAGVDIAAQGVIAPGQTVPVARQGALTQMRWGFVPHWAREDSGTKIINARSETLAEKPSFRDAFRTRRCIVPADAFYEWDAATKPKTAYELSPTAGFLAMAGIYDVWQGLETFAIVTTAASADIAHLHHRMPVLLSSPAAIHKWLAPDTAPEALAQLAIPPENSGLILAPATLETRGKAPDKQLALF